MVLGPCVRSNSRVGCRKAMNLVGGVLNTGKASFCFFLASASSALAEFWVVLFRAGSPLPVSWAGVWKIMQRAGNDLVQ